MLNQNNQKDIFHNLNQWIQLGIHIFRCSSYIFLFHNLQMDMKYLIILNLFWF